MLVVLNPIFNHIIYINKYLINTKTFIIVKMISNYEYITIYTATSISDMLLYCSNLSEIDYNELERKIFENI